MQALVGLLTGNDPDLCIAAAGCLTNMAAGTHEHAKAVFNAAGAYFVTYLQSSSAALQVRIHFDIIYGINLDMI